MFNISLSLTIFALILAMAFNCLFYYVFCVFSFGKIGIFTADSYFNFLYKNKVFYISMGIPLFLIFRLIWNRSQKRKLRILSIIYAFLLLLVFQSSKNILVLILHYQSYQSIGCGDDIGPLLHIPYEVAVGLGKIAGVMCVYKWDKVSLKSVTAVFSLLSLTSAYFIFNVWKRDHIEWLLLSFLTLIFYVFTLFYLRYLRSKSDLRRVLPVQSKIR
jgi:hypothetical protein